VKGFRQIVGKGGIEVEEGKTIAIDEVRCPAREEGAVANAMVQFDEAIEVNKAVCTPWHSRLEEGVNCYNSKE
jgi:hypothetical protein